jgi:hypothetical protein
MKKQTQFVLKGMHKDIKTKDQAIWLAIDWQKWSSEQDLSYSELADWAMFFTKLGRKFGLLKEFRENGII